MVSTGIRISDMSSAVHFLQYILFTYSAQGMHIVSMKSSFWKYGIIFIRSPWMGSPQKSHTLTFIFSVLSEIL